MRIFVIALALIVGGVAGASIQYQVSSRQREDVADVYLEKLDDKIRENIGLQIENAQLKVREHRVTEQCLSSGETVQMARSQ